MKSESFEQQADTTPEIPVEKLGADLPPEDRNEMYMRASQMAADENKIDTEQHIKDIKMTINRAQMHVVPETPETVGTTFTSGLDKKSETEPRNKSFLQKAAIWGSMALGLSSLTKEAKAQLQKNVEKESTKKEYKYTRDTLSKEEITEYKEAFSNLTVQNKTDWNAFIEHLQELGLSGNPDLNHKALSEKVMNDWIAANPGTTVSPDMIKNIQKGLVYYEESADALERKAEAKGQTIASDAKPGDKNITFMTGLKHTKVDGFVGQFTSTYKFPIHISTTTTVNHINTALAGTHEIAQVIQKGKPTYQGFATPPDDQVENSTKNK